MAVKEKSLSSLLGWSSIVKKMIGKHVRNSLLLNRGEDEEEDQHSIVQAFMMDMKGYHCITRAWEKRGFPL